MNVQGQPMLKEWNYSEHTKDVDWIELAQQACLLCCLPHLKPKLATEFISFKLFS
jgi:hypothetical protein